MPGHDNTGPYVRAAALCRDVTRNSEGQVDGLIGMLDRVTLPAGAASGQAKPFRVEVKAVLELVAGSAQGKRRVLEFKTQDPTGRQTGSGELTIEFIDRETAVASVVIDYGIDVVGEGEHWLNVYLVPDLNARARLLTRIPLHVGTKA